MYLSVLDTPFFRGLIEEKDREWVESLFLERRYPKGQILFFQGDESPRDVHREIRNLENLSAAG